MNSVDGFEWLRSEKSDAEAAQSDDAIREVESDARPRTRWKQSEGDWSPSSQWLLAVVVVAVAACCNLDLL
jgi:hypothetical protein